MQQLRLEAGSAAEMEQLAARFAQGLVAAKIGAEITAGIKPGMVIALQGLLGAGKTTWCRGLLRALGYRGIVKSPTYTLVESYQFEQLAWCLHHFDLYRMVDSEELEYIGGRDYFDDSSVCVVEWPERGEGVMPPADIAITFGYMEKQADGRCLTLTAGTMAGERLLALW